MADLAYLFKWPPSELEQLTAADLLMWHAQAQRIGRELNSKP
jgi:hypothetical protein